VFLEDRDGRHVGNDMVRDAVSRHGSSTQCWACSVDIRPSGATTHVEPRTARRESIASYWSK